jgi:hypothetical protein
MAGSVGSAGRLIEPRETPSFAPFTVGAAVRATGDDMPTGAAGWAVRAGVVDQMSAEQSAALLTSKLPPLDRGLGPLRV